MFLFECCHLPTKDFLSMEEKKTMEDILLKLCDLIYSPVHALEFFCDQFYGKTVNNVS